MFNNRDDQGTDGWDNSQNEAALWIYIGWAIGWVHDTSAPGPGIDIDL
jgi:hypothetical protein